MNGELSWRKSSSSGGSGGNCVEVAEDDGHILVRDTKNTKDHGRVHQCTAAEWRAFVAVIKAENRWYYNSTSLRCAGTEGARRVT